MTAPLLKSDEAFLCHEADTYCKGMQQILPVGEVDRSAVPPESCLYDELPLNE